MLSRAPHNKLEARISQLQQKVDGIVESGGGVSSWEELTGKPASTPAEIDAAVEAVKEGLGGAAELHQAVFAVATAGQTTFELTWAPDNIESLLVQLNGTTIETGYALSVSGSTLSVSPGLDEGSVLRVLGSAPRRGGAPATEGAYGATVTGVPDGGQIVVSHPEDSEFRRVHGAYKFVPGEQLTNTALSFDVGHAAAFSKTGVEFAGGKVRLVLDEESPKIGVPYATVTGNTKDDTWITLRVDGTPVDARALRLYVTRTIGKIGLIVLEEVELYDENGQKIPTDGMVASATSVYNYMYTPDQAIDGAYGNSYGWASSGYIVPPDTFDRVTGQATIEVYPGEYFVAWQVVLPASKKISKVRLRGGYSAYADCVPTDFHVQFSADPAVQVSSSLWDPRWFGVDLLNGSEVDTEKTDGVTSRGMVPPYRNSGMLVTTDQSAVDTGNWERVKSMLPAQNVTTSTDLRYAFSFDGRNTWKVFDGTAWTSVLIDELGLQGMTKDMVEAVTQTQWQEVALGAQIDLAVSFTTGDPAKTPELDQVTFVAQGQGQWRALKTDGTSGGVKVDLYNKQTVFTNLTGGVADMAVVVGRPSGGGRGVSSWGEIDGKPVSSPAQIDAAVGAIPGLQAALDTKADKGHRHDIGDLNTTGVASAETTLHGNAAWAKPASGGGGNGSVHGTTITAVPNNGQVHVSHPRDTSFRRMLSVSKFVAGTQVTDTTLSFDVGHADAFDKTNVEFVDGKVRLARDTSQPPSVGKWASVTNNTVGGTTSPVKWVSLRLATPIVARVLRLYVTKVTTGPFLAIQEVELFDESGVKINLAGATATATSEYGTAPMKAPAAIDGVVGSDANGTYFTTGDSSYPPAAFSSVNGEALLSPHSGENFVAWQIVLPEARTISRVRVVSGFGSGDATMRDFLVQFSTDPAASVNFSKNHVAWFGANLINGDVSGNEKTDGTITQVEVYPYFTSGGLTTTVASAVNTGNWEKIKSMVLAQVTPAGTDLRYVFSFDGRTTWQVFGGAGWLEIDPADMGTAGMTKAAIEAITQGQWEQVALGEQFDLMVGFHTDDPDKTPELDQVTFTAQGSGTWQALPIGVAGGVDVIMENNQTIFKNKTGGTIDMTAAVSIGS